MNYFKAHKNKKPKKLKYSSYYTKQMKKDIENLCDFFSDKTNKINFSSN